MPYKVNVYNHGQFYTVFDAQPDPYIGLRQFAQKIGYIYTDVTGLMDWDIELPDNVFPKTARELNGRKKLYDILNMFPRCTVSERFKNLIEEYEPGTHQFSAPIDVFYRDGRPAEQRYYGLHMCRYVTDMAVPEKFVRPPDFSIQPAGFRGNAEPYKQYSAPETEDYWYLDEAAIKGRHFWVSYETFSYWWMSDEFVRAVKKAKIVGMRFTHHRSGPR